MEQIQQYIKQLQGTLGVLPLESIFDVIQRLHEARLSEQQVFVLGNGGSASTASHIVCDLAKNTKIDGVPHFRIFEITDNTAVFSAYANDEGYENAFAHHLANFVRPKDVVI
jgi:D-sedoheptulose 7-phosphate isomerase